MEIHTDAPVVTRDEILIGADIATVWRIQTDVSEWPSWQPDVESATVDGAVVPGTVFRWRTGGLDIESTIREVDAPGRIAWDGPANGIFAAHVWTLEDRNGSTLVRTAESWEGEPIEQQVEQMQHALDASLHDWLQNLKRTAEQAR